MINKKNKYIKITIGTGLVIAIAFAILNLAKAGDLEVNLSKFPDNKNYAFSITDDPDRTRLEAIKPIYDFLNEKDIKTTIAVWTDEAKRRNGVPEKIGEYDYGDTCERKEYLDYIKYLQKAGYEIASHGASGGNDYRNETIEGYEKFKAYFESYPKINIMHAENLENLYWGKKVVNNSLLQLLIGSISKKARFPFGGEIKGSPYFWGDICKTNTKYVRLWGTYDINTLKFNPSMPYYDPKKPFVNYWFSFSYGDYVEDFNNLITENNINRLSEERGACIVYTHFSHKFAIDGKLDQVFKERIEFLSKDDQGWFVPVSEILDRLIQIRNIDIIKKRNLLLVVNKNNQNVAGITILTNKKTVLVDENKKYQTNDENEILIGDIGANEAIVLRVNNDVDIVEDYQPSIFEKMNMIFQRFRIYFS